MTGHDDHEVAVQMVHVQDVPQTNHHRAGCSRALGAPIAVRSHSLDLVSAMHPTEPRHAAADYDDGEGVADAAVFAQANGGLSIQRAVISKFTQWGLRLDQYAAHSPHNFISKPIFLSDLDVHQVAMPGCGSDDGRSEAELWLGNTGRGVRIRVRECGWMRGGWEEKEVSPAFCPS